jgi:NitT/TauT family transport system permease protein
MAVLRVLVVALLVGIWQTLTARHVLDPFYWGMPSKILALLWDWIRTGYIFRHIGITLLECAIGFVAGVVLAVVAAVLIARYRLLRELFMPFMAAFNALPRVSLAPLFILWFGMGLLSKVAMVISAVFFVVFFNALRGVTDVDRLLLRNARVLGADRRSIAIHVYLPSMLGWIAASLRIGIGFAIVGAIIGEYIGAAAGIGHIIETAQSYFNTSAVLAGILVLMLIAGTIDWGIAKVESHFASWKSTR